MTHRKIVQIAAIPRADPEPDTVLALADDGTIWLAELNVHQPDWRQVPPIPEPEAADNA